MSLCKLINVVLITCDFSSCFMGGKQEGQCVLDAVSPYRDVFLCFMYNVLYLGARGGGGARGATWYQPCPDVCVEK